MDFDKILKFAETLKNDPLIGLIFVLLGVIVFLGMRVRKLENLLEEKDRKYEKLIYQYHKNHGNVVEAFNGLKLLLVEIKGRLL